MTQAKLTLGQAIDQVIGALENLDPDARKTAIETACAHLKIAVAHAAVSPSAATRPLLEVPGDVKSTVPRQRANDIRSLRAEKNPKSAREMACIVAFYLQEIAPESERKDSISAADLEKYFKQANFKLPEKIGQVLPDAKSSGYFDSSARGAYKLNAVGYNLVAHKLPSGPGAQ